MYESHPYLFEVKSNVYDIPDRVKEIDPSFFIVRNAKMQRFELHSTENKDGTTFCLVIPFKELDSRAIDHIRKHDVLTRGRAIFDEMEEHNRKVEQNKARRQRNFVESVARDIHSAVKRDAEVNGI